MYVFTLRQRFGGVGEFPPGPGLINVDGMIGAVMESQNWGCLECLTGNMQAGEFREYDGINMGWHFGGVTMWFSARVVELLRVNSKAGVPWRQQGLLQVTGRVLGNNSETGSHQGTHTPLPEFKFEGRVVWSDAKLLGYCFCAASRWWQRKEC